MKNFIKSNYNISIDKIYKNNNHYFFYSNSEKIYILKVSDNKKRLDALIELSNELYKYNYEISTFIKNNKNEYYTKYDNKYIVLLKYNDILNDKLEFKDLKIHKLDKYLDDYKIVDHFKNEIDELEQEIIEYNKEFPLIQRSINYFIGMSENAIQLLNDVNINNNYLCHDIKIKNCNKIEFNNPFNLIRTNYLYDYANYFKHCFYYAIIDYDELYYFIKRRDKEELIIFFGLMLYQKEYFEDVKDIFKEKIDEEVINIYINKIDQYKELLKYIKNSVNIREINEIEWLDR